MIRTGGGSSAGGDSPDSVTQTWNVKFTFIDVGSLSWVDGSPGLKEPLPLFPDSQRGVADSPGTP